MSMAAPKQAPYFKGTRRRSATSPSTQHPAAESERLYHEAGLHPVGYAYHLNKMVKRSRQIKQTDTSKVVLQLCVLGAILFLMVQLVRSSISGLYQIAVLSQTQPVVEHYLQNTQNENRILKDQIKRYSSPNGLEELARNYLNLTGKNEILIQID